MNDGASGSQLVSLIPGANTTGTNISTPTPTVPGGSTPSVGGQTNPFLSAMPTGQTAFPANSPFATGFPLPNFGPITGSLPADWSNFDKALKSLGYPTGVAQAIGAFLESGAGYNPQVAAAFVNALMPEFSREQANLTEQFGASGLRGSSAAAIGLGDLFSQQGLDVGQLLGSMYEQSVQNYMNVLMGIMEETSHAPGGGVLGALSGLLSGLGGGRGIGSLISSIGSLGGGVAAAGGAAAGGGLAAGAGSAAGLAGIAALGNTETVPMSNFFAPGSGSSDVNTLGY